MSVDCSKSNRTADEIKYCACQDTISSIKQQMAAYDEKNVQYALDDASYNRWSVEHANWQNKIGNYSKYAKYGVSENFKIEWGYTNADTNTRCSECAKRKLENGWWDDGKGMARNAGVAGQDIRCNLKPGTSLQGWEYYVDDQKTWGWNESGRKWWTCTKSESGKQTELTEYNNAEPLSDPQNPSVNWKVKGRPTAPTIPSFGDIVCCNQTFSGLSVANGSININNISQNCNINTVTTPTPKPTTVTTPKPTVTTPKPTVTMPKPIPGLSGFNNNTIVIIVMVIIIICMSMSSLLGVGLTFTSDE